MRDHGFRVQRPQPMTPLTPVSTRYSPAVAKRSPPEPATIEPSANSRYIGMLTPHSTPRIVTVSGRPAGAPEADGAGFGDEGAIDGGGGAPPTGGSGAPADGARSDGGGGGGGSGGATRGGTSGAGCIGSVPGPAGPAIGAVGAAAIGGGGGGAAYGRGGAGGGTTPMPGAIVPSGSIAGISVVGGAVD